jgi:hypothetical protein
MSDKKKYEPPQLFRVELNPEQAILSACSLTTTAVANGGNMICRAGIPGCKNFTGVGTGDSGPRLS